MDLTDLAPARVLNALTAINPSVADDVGRRWREHRDAGEPLMVVFGPNNAGKTSLLQRLLVDDAQPVPEWLRVNARPEETSGAEIHWRGWRVLDLPGLGSEQEEHERTAWDGVELADAVVLVMSLKMLTGEGLDAMGVLDGSWWSAGELPLPWPNGALHVVIARVDAGSADPADDPEELDDLKAELDPQVQELLSDLDPRPPVSWVAASPSGILRSGHAPEETLVASRAWDGMSELEDGLAAAADGVDRFRAAALVRYLHRIGHLADEELARQSTRLEERATSARISAAGARLVDQQVDAALAATEARVRAIVLECFSAIVDSDTSTPEAAMRSELARRADTGEQEFRRDVAALVDDLQRTVESMPAVSPGSGEKLRAAQPARGKDGKPIPWTKASSHVGKLVEEGVTLKLGDTTAGTKAKLKSLEGKEGEALTKALQKAGFGSEAEAAAARDLLKKYDAAMKVIGAVPQFIELVRFGQDVKRGHDARSRAKRLQAREEELVETLAESLLQGPRGFRARLERVREAAHEALPAAEDASELDAAVVRIREWRDELRAALAELRAAT